MSGMLRHTFAGDLEIRSDGRTIVGIAVPFDQPARVNDGFGPYTEVFRKGAFSKTITERRTSVKALANHDRRGLPLGTASMLREDAAGLYTELRVSKTQAGDDALQLVRDKALDSFSIGFAGLKERRSEDGTVERTEVRLDEISLVAFPAYEGASIAGVRNAAPGLDAAGVDDLRNLFSRFSPLDELDDLLARRASLYRELEGLLADENPSDENLETMRRLADDLSAVARRIEATEVSSAVEEPPETEAAESTSRGEAADGTSVEGDEPASATRRSLTEAAIKRQVADLDAYLKRKDAA